jgi:hypothetical protein
MGGMQIKRRGRYAGHEKLSFNPRNWVYENISGGTMRRFCKAIRQRLKHLIL